MPSWIQRTFSGGEISPQLFARADQAKYVTGARTMRNFIATRFGGATNRPGLGYICEVKDSTKRVRLLKFVFNASQTYILEFGNLYMRVIKNGVQLTSGGVPYEIATPYAEADLQTLQFAQSADVITISHRNYAPRDLSRLADTNWTLALTSFVPTAGRPTNLAAAVAGANVYRVTYYVAETGEESLYALGAAKAITGATKANPCVITCNAHGFANGDEIRIASVGGMTELNERTFVVQNQTANTFELQGENSTGYGTYTAGGSAYATVAKSTGTVTWTQPAGVTSGTYYVYKQVNGVFGYIGQAYAPGSSTGTFTDSSITPQTDITPPVERRMFVNSGDWPALVTYAQQRLVFASTSNDPETVWMSQIGNYRNFSIHTPIQSDDAVTFTLAGRQVQEVRAVVELGNMVMLTSGGEWDIAGDADGVVRPTAINLRQRGYYGSATLAPVVIRDSVLYVQARGSIVSDLQYEFATSGYKGRDLTVYAQHLFDGYQIGDWDFAQIPNSILWAVRSDGMLLGLTYVREHEVWGWHKHDTDGTFENVAVVPEGGEDVLYVVVRRLINGTYRRYIERMPSRFVTDVAVDARFLDCFGTYDGRYGVTSATSYVKLRDGVTWASTETLRLEANDGAIGLFDPSMVGKMFRLYVGTETVECTVIGYTSNVNVTVTVNRDVPVAFRATSITRYDLCTATLTGLGYLEGRTVSILADGFVQPTAVVSGGSITLQRPYGVIYVGLPITADLELLDLESTQSETLMDKRKRINRVVAIVQDTRAIYAGPDADHLREAKLRAGEDYSSPIDPVTGPTEVLLNGSWDDNGRVFIRNTDPLPVTVLAVIRSGDVR